jgi:hypothetical protein
MKKLYHCGSSPTGVYPNQFPTPENDEISAFLDVPCQMSLPMSPFSPNEVAKAIAHTNARKAPGYDLITGKVLKELPKKAVTLLTILYNSMLHLSCYPLLWIFAQIVMVTKHGKPINDVTSYRPISFLPLPSKIFEKLLLQRLLSMLSLPFDLLAFFHYLEDL